MNDSVYRLSQFGFNTYEAKAYLALLQKHPAIGYEVSKIAKIPTSKIYETLISLKNKGAILSSASEPVLYYPIEPDVLLNRIQIEFDVKMKSLNGLLNKIPSIPNIDITWNLSGYQSVVGKIASVIQNAEEVLLVSLWPQEAKALKNELVKADHKGIRVIAGIFGAYDPGCSCTINLESCGESSHKRLGKRLNVAVADSKEVVISEMSDGEETSGIWTTSPCIILTAKEYIKHDIWGKALVDAVGKERFDEMCKNSEVLSYLIETR